MSTILEVKNLSKYYNGTAAVDDISFSIREGICFGLLGPNGAGKTTTIEIIEGITEKSAGEIYYDGRNKSHEFKQQSGIQFQSTALQEFLTVKETITLFSRLYNKSLALDHIIELCALQEFQDRDTRRLSGGQRQRLLLALALVNDPKILFLDEPTTGLDPQARRNFWDLVNKIKAQNKTIVLTTHYMDEAAILCDELLIMDRGKIIAQGVPKELLNNYFGDVILQIPQQDLNINGEPLQLSYHIRDGKMIFNTRDVNETLRVLNEYSADLKKLEIRSRNLDDLFLELTGRDLRS